MTTDNNKRIRGLTKRQRERIIRAIKRFDNLKCFALNPLLRIVK